jgi:hypothetical protein
MSNDITSLTIVIAALLFATAFLIGSIVLGAAASGACHLT